MGDLCGLHTIENNKHDVSRLQGKKQMKIHHCLAKLWQYYFPTLEISQNTDIFKIFILTVC